MRWMDARRAIMVTGAGFGLVACSYFAAETTTVAEITPLGFRPSPQGEQLLAEARHLFAENNAGLALARVEGYLNANPQSANGHNLAGAIFDNIGRYDLAERHYEKALTLQGDYLPAVNNFGLSKLQRARASGRLDLEQEAEVLLARAVALSADPEQVLRNQASARAALSEHAGVQQAVSASPAPVKLVQRSVWLERRGENYSFVVTRPSAAATDALIVLNLDPAIAFVSPGATFGTSRISIAGSRPQRLRSWASVPEAAPRFFGATSGLSYLSLTPQSLKPRWYTALASACDGLRPAVATENCPQSEKPYASTSVATATSRTVPGLTFYASAKPALSETNLNARVAALLTMKSVP